MAIRVVCPYCASRLKAPADLAGEEVRCRRCKRTFTITLPAAAGQPEQRSLLPWVLAGTLPLVVLAVVGACWIWRATDPRTILPEHHWHHAEEHHHATLDAEWAAVQRQQEEAAHQMASAEAERRRVREEEAAREEKRHQEHKAREERRAGEEQARQQQAEEARRQTEVAEARAAILERADRAGRRMTEYLETEIKRAGAFPPPGVTPAAAAGQRSLVITRASALVRTVQELHAEGKLDKSEAYDLLTNGKYEWNVPFYRDAIHTEAAHLASTFGDAIPFGRKAETLVTLGAAWDCCNRLVGN